MNLKHTGVPVFFRLIFFALAIICIASFTSCKDDPIEYDIDRSSALSFRLDTFDVVTTSDVVFYLGPSVLHLFEDSSQVLFQRISLQAHGNTPDSREYWLIVDFDTHADGNALGLYRSIYDLESGGISEMRLIIDLGGVFVEFKSVSDINAVFFQVDGQHTEERLMRGIFGGILFKDGDPQGQTVYIADGAFTDIKY
jgi:hypothetical protein